MFAHILTGEEWRIKHIDMLLQGGYIEKISPERYSVIKAFQYNTKVLAEIGDIVATCPGTQPKGRTKYGELWWPEVLLIPNTWSNSLRIPNE